MFNIFGLLPIISMSLLIVNLIRKGLCARRALLLSAVVWGLVITTVTEVSSVLNKLNFLWLSITWSLIVIIQICALYYVDEIKAKQTNNDYSMFTTLLLSSVVGIVIITGITAIVAPPNNWDSMTYHMSRIMHWIQNQSVAHYPTSILRQIESNPWAEFAITNLQILSGGDYLANIVQWFSMIGSVVGVSLIAEKLGADRRGQIIAAVVAATIPMGILQSSSTQNDCVVSLWLVCLVYFGIRFNEQPCWSYASVVGASLGLALLTKGTAYIFAFPLAIWFAMYSFKSIKLITVKYIILILLIAMSLNIGHYIRNFEVFGNVLSSGENKYSNDIFSLPFLVSNVTRNFALEAASPFQYANHIIESGVKLLHVSMGLDINDKLTTWPFTEFIVVDSRSEDAAGNPLHLMLITFAIFAVCCSEKIRRKQNILPYSFSLVIAFMLFCLYLKWQPWQNRLLLPLLILWSPVVAVVITEIKRVWAANTILIAVLATSLQYLFFNNSRPLISKDNKESIFTAERTSQYFIHRPTLMQEYQEIARKLKYNNCNSVAIRTGSDTWEYPLWVFMQKEFGQNIRIEHINVGNISGKIPIHSYNYCEVVTLEK